MTTADALRLLRDTISAVDGQASGTDDVLLQALADALRVFRAKKLTIFSSYTLDPTITDQDQPGYGFSPELTDTHGLMLVLKAAVENLSRELRGRLKRGELGISWQSGLEQESSVTAAKEYRAMIDQIDEELQELLLIQANATSTERVQ